MKKFLNQLALGFSLFHLSSSQILSVHAQVRSVCTSPQGDTYWIPLHHTHQIQELTEEICPQEKPKCFFHKLAQLYHLINQWKTKSCRTSKPHTASDWLLTTCSPRNSIIVVFIYNSECKFKEKRNIPRLVNRKKPLNVNISLHLSSWQRHRSGTLARFLVLQHFRRLSRRSSSTSNSC